MSEVFHIKKQKKKICDLDQKICRRVELGFDVYYFVSEFSPPDRVDSRFVFV